MARKKIVFVIVEGPSDDQALSVLLDNIYDDSSVYVYIAHCDVTTEPGVNSSTILNKLGAIVDGYAKSNHLKKIHFQEIVHIVDIDGVYIPDDSVVLDETAKKPKYSLTEIKTANVEGIINRNSVKRGCLDKISTTPKLWGVPYQAYYMSCNLDHVLYNKLNCTDDEKELNAFKFAKKYKKDLEGFVKFITESNFSATGDYLESWEYIKQDKHSLERHTNLGVCIKKAIQK